jgi:hypothetical protein
MVNKVNKVSFTMFIHSVQSIFTTFAILYKVTIFNYRENGREIKRQRIKRKMSQSILTNY